MTAQIDPRKGKLTLVGETIAGCLSGGCTRFAVGPLDVAKIKMQLGGTLGMVGTLLDLYNREGLVSLWRGSATGVSLWVCYMGVQFPVYRAFKRGLEEGGNGGVGTGAAATLPWHPSAPSLLAGGLAGAVATGITYPLDWARTRLTMASDYRAVGSFRALVGWALSKEGGGGLASMYRGLTPSILAVAPGTALTFGFYEALGRAWDGVLAGTSDSGGGVNGGLAAASSKALVCGSVGGGLAKLAVYPLDTVKKRMQVEARGGARQHHAAPPLSTTLSTFVGIVRGEGGVGALFRGLTPSLAKAMASSGLAFTFYEGACWGLVGLGHPWVVVPS